MAVSSVIVPCGTPPLFPTLHPNTGALFAEKQGKAPPLDYLTQLLALMPFFKDLRRRKANSKTANSANRSNESNESNATVPTTKSSSTLDSIYATSTPASSIQPHQSTPNFVTSRSASTMTPTPQRPTPLGSVSNRSSFMVCIFLLFSTYKLPAEAGEWGN